MGKIGKREKLEKFLKRVSRKLQKTNKVKPPHKTKNPKARRHDRRDSSKVDQVTPYSAPPLEAPRRSYTHPATIQNLLQELDVKHLLTIISQENKIYCGWESPLEDDVFRQVLDSYVRMTKSWFHTHEYLVDRSGFYLRPKVLTVEFGSHYTSTATQTYQRYFEIFLMNQEPMNCGERFKSGFFVPVNKFCSWWIFVLLLRQHGRATLVGTMFRWSCIWVKIVTITKLKMSADFEFLAKINNNIIIKEKSIEIQKSTLNVELLNFTGNPECYLAKIELAHPIQDVAFVAGTVGIFNNTAAFKEVGGRYIADFKELKISLSTRAITDLRTWSHEDEKFIQCLDIPSQEPCFRFKISILYGEDQRRLGSQFTTRFVVRNSRAKNNSKQQTKKRKLSTENSSSGNCSNIEENLEELTDLPLVLQNSSFQLVNN